MTVGAKLRKVRAKDIQGTVYTLEIEPEKTIGDVKKLIAKKMNEKSEETKDPNVKLIHPKQLRLTDKDKQTDHDDNEIVKDIGDMEEDFVFVFVGDASNVPINVKIHVFKGTGVENTTLDLNLGDTADVIKDKLIAASFGPADKGYTLFYKGRPMLDKKPIMDYGIENGSEILVGVIM